MAKKTKKIRDNSQDNIAKLLKNQTEQLIEIFDDRIQTVQEEFNGINKKLDSHSDQIANLTMDMLEVKSDLKQVKFDVKMNLDNKVDKKHFVNLEGRVRVLEKHKK